MLTSKFDNAYDFDPSAAPHAKGAQPELVWELATMFPAQGAWSVREYLELTVLSLPEGAKEYTEHGVFRPGQTATSVLLDGFTVDVKACFDAAKQ